MVMWQHNVYYVCVTFSVVRYVCWTARPTYLTTLNEAPTNSPDDDLLRSKYVRMFLSVLKLTF